MNTRELRDLAFNKGVNVDADSLVRAYNDGTITNIYEKIVHQPAQKAQRDLLDLRGTLDAGIAKSGLDVRG